MKGSARYVGRAGQSSQQDRDLTVTIIVQSLPSTLWVLMATSPTARALTGNASNLYIGLTNLPRTALPSDLRRLCAKCEVGIAHVAIDYKRFKPAGTATLALPRPESVVPTLKALNGSVLGGKKVRSRTLHNVSREFRGRGSKGLLEAAQRGIVTGDGPDAGISGGGKNVLLCGLPLKTLPAQLADRLRNYKLAGLEQGRPVVIKLTEEKVTSSTARFLLRLESVSEAYRLTRTLHMHKWRPDLYGNSFTVRATVIS
ncbi:hypothetical protein C8Q80DRAFT_1170648 [Daedaleopsis nitida]|nr:hypothetical protein C8Q80DRAFT_1170648 [Daedaleopsis nitida]